MWTTDFEILLRNYCRLAPPDKEVPPDVPFTALGVDSFAILRLISDLEVLIGAALPDELLSAEVFHTPGGLWEVMHPLLRSAPESQPTSRRDKPPAQDSPQPAPELT